MHHEFSEYALVDFINNYTQGLLQRTLRSDNSKHYKVWKLVDEDNNNTTDSRPKIRVPELTTKTFLNTILDPSKVSQMQCMIIVLLTIMFENNM